MGAIPSWLQVDRILVFAVANRVWQSCAGLVTLVLIAKLFVPEVQGYYYTFLSLIGLQSFLELGLTMVIISAASHESAHLNIGADGSISGDVIAKARLAALLRFVVAWFGLMAILFAAVAWFVGDYMLSPKSSTAVEWRLPWAACVIVSGLNLWLSSIVVLVEGSNRMMSVVRFRLAQSLFGAITLWILMFAQASLLSLAGMLIANLVSICIFLLTSQRRFIGELFSISLPGVFSWKHDIWPMQWPLAIQGLANYFMYSLFVPVLFRYSDSVEAGRMGMSLQILTAVAAIATTILAIRAPALGANAARRDYGKFWELWKRSATFSLLVAFAGVTLVLSGVWAASYLHLAIVDRISDSWTMLLLAFWLVLNQVVQCAAAYWRAMRLEPTGIWGAIPGLLTGFFVWQGGMSFGSIGEAVGCLFVVVFVTLPMGYHFWRKMHRLSLTWSNAENRSL